MPAAPSARPDDIFGTDGVRGVAGEEITPSLARDVAGAFAALLTEDALSPTVLLARDTRVSGPELADAFGDELCRCGVGVVDCGVIPTGGLCLLVARRDADGGAVISASHNPPEANGIKLVGRGGHKLPAARQHLLEDLIRGDRDGCPSSAQSAAMRRDETQAAEEYQRLVMEDLPPDCLAGLHVVLDCAHGSASRFAPAVFERAGARVEAINCDADGARINVNCGSTSPGALASAVVAAGAHIGVAFDGDADRAMLTDHRGRVVDGDGMKYILALDRHGRGLLEPPLVVGTVMNNFGLERALRDHGITLERTPVGDRHVVERMRETGALIGGEQSGHIIFRETLIGDGICTALRLCEVVARSGRTLAELAAPVKKIPQHLVNLHADDRDAWETCDEVREEIERWERRLEGAGRILVRASGTEPLVRVMIEAEDAELAQAAVDAVSAKVQEACDGQAEA
ncbi:MAG: phosphoglucosamine mutase [Armatimonadota bacterium]|jgi:phosphoglucosamine mutase